MEEDLGPGVALALTDLQCCFGIITQGFADVMVNKPVAADMLFEIGSFTKTFTVIACLQQVQTGKLDLITDPSIW